MIHACPYTVTAGSFVLGVLTAQERNQFHRHTEECPYCRSEVLDLTPVADLLTPLKAEVRFRFK